MDFQNLLYMPTKLLSDRHKLFLKNHRLTKKFNKQIKLFQQNPRHPSLHTELLEPKSAGVYSFRIDRRYRTLFVIINSNVEIVDINDHYQ